MTRRIELVNHSRHGMTVHKPGCADIARDEKKRLVNSRWVIEIADGADVADAAIKDLNDGFGWSPDDDEPPPWSTDDVRILPCTKGI